MKAWAISCNTEKYSTIFGIINILIQLLRKIACSFHDPLEGHIAVLNHQTFKPWVILRDIHTQWIWVLDVLKIGYSNE